MQSKAFRILLPVVIILAAFAVFVVLMKTRPQAQRRRPPTPVPTVSVGEVLPDDEPILIQGFGSVQAKRSVAITPQVSGEVTHKDPAFQPGAYFEEGQVLLKLDDTDYQLALAQARANVASAEVSLAREEEEARVARQDWSRLADTDLQGSGQAAEPSALVLREPQLKLARASLASAQAALNQALVNLERCTISAPFAGRVLEEITDVGQYVRAGNPLGTIYATDVAEITVPVPDADLAWIKLDSAAEGSGSVTITAEFAGAVHTWNGRAVRLGGAVDTRSRLVPVVVEVDNPYQQQGDRPPLVEGMFVQATFAGQPPAGSVIIPRAALRPGDKVWVVQGGKIHVMEANVVRAGVHQAVIAGGLRPGQKVCTSNLQFVTDGMPVRLEGQAAPRQSGTDRSDAGKGGE